MCVRVCTCVFELNIGPLEDIVQHNTGLHALVTLLIVRCTSVFVTAAVKQSAGCFCSQLGGVDAHGCSLYVCLGRVKAAAEHHLHRSYCYFLFKFFFFYKPRRNPNFFFHFVEMC